MYGSGAGAGGGGQGTEGAAAGRGGFSDGGARAGKAGFSGGSFKWKRRDSNDINVNDIFERFFKDSHGKDPLEECVSCVFFPPPTVPGAPILPFP